MPKIRLPGWHSSLYSWVGRFETAAVDALSADRLTLRTLALSLRSNAIKLPDSSLTAMHTGTPIFLAFAAAALISFCASARFKRLILSTKAPRKTKCSD